MAKGQLLTMSSLEGSIGGLTFRNEAGGSVMYGKKIPKVSVGSVVSAKKMIIVYFASSWRTMTPDSRRRWRSTTFNHMSGFQLYMYCRLNLHACGTIANISPKPAPRFPALTQTGLTSVAGGSKQARIATLPNPATGFYAEVQTTQPVSPGIKVVNESLFRTVLVVDEPSTGFYTCTSNYNQLFGSDNSYAGAKVFTRARWVHKTSGYASTWLYATNTVT